MDISINVLLQPRFTVVVRVLVLFFCELLRLGFKPSFDLTQLRVPQPNCLQSSTGNGTIVCYFLVRPEVTCTAQQQTP